MGDDAAFIELRASYEAALEAAQRGNTIAREVLNAKMFTLGRSGFRHRHHVTA